VIDHSLVISPLAALLFHLKQGFWLCAWPMLIGFLTIFGYQVLGRVTMMSNAKWPVVFVLGTGVSMISLFGWVVMVRGVRMIPFYGCGCGLASTLMSRVYAITMRVHPRLKMRMPRVIWRGDRVAIEQMQEALRTRAAAQTPAAPAATVEAVRARV
jgi:hypothetical protein